MSFPFKIDEIFSIDSNEAFEEIALAFFHHQASENPVYKIFLSNLKINPKNVKNTFEIPFLPISLFKSHEVKTGKFNAETIFYSSTTTGNTPSRHFVKDQNLYFKSFKKAFQQFYGTIEKRPILALLPSYLEREGSSLIVMVNALIKDSNRKESGFFLNDLDSLVKTLNVLEAKNEAYFLIGVSFALLELAEVYKLNLKNATIIETGGMKGRRKEVIRKELHQQIAMGLGNPNIQSEYGMTELLSQAYAKRKGIFETPPWMKVLIRDTTDPLTVFDSGRGGINVIDLANIHSCAFIATQDLGKLYSDGTFEVLGRFDDAEVRGCNLMFN